MFDYFVAFRYTINCLPHTAFALLTNILTMSHPDPLYDPSEEVLGNNGEPVVEPQDEPEPCPDCDGRGTICTPAYQSGGEIIDEVCHPCHCQV